MAPGESYERDRQEFAMAHAGHWIVIAALRSDHHPGMTEVIASLGGNRDERAVQRRFLVPSNDCEVGRFGFVIEETRHAAYDGPSSFASWRQRAHNVRFRKTSAAVAHGCGAAAGATPARSNRPADLRVE